MRGQLLRRRPTRAPATPPASTTSLHQAAFAARPRRQRRAAVDRLGKITRRRDETHHLEGERRERHADQQFGDADAAAIARHHAAVGAAREHAAAGDGMAVDRGHHRLRDEMNTASNILFSAGRNRAYILAPPSPARTRSTPAEKIRALPGDHHGLGLPLAQLGELAVERVAKLDVERVGLAVAQREQRDAVSPVTSIMSLAPST